MDDPAFSGMGPLRVPEARRRMLAITEYLTLPHPKKVDTMHFAERLNLSRTQFTRLVGVWQNHRDARLLVIGRRGSSTRDYGIAEQAITIAHEVITQQGVSTTLSKAAPEIERRCAIEGLVPPSRQTIWNYIRKVRAVSGVTADGPPRIVVGRMWFHLPIRGIPRNEMPTLLAAVVLPERVIVAHAISVDPENPASVPNLVEQLVQRRTLGAKRRQLLISPDDRRAATDVLASAGLRGIRSHNRSVQSEISKAFGGSLGHIPAVYRRAKARPMTKRIITRQDEHLQCEAAIAAIESAIDYNNAAAPVTNPEFDVC